MGEDTIAGAPGHPWRVLVAAALIMILFGSLYAWSIFLEPLQAALGATRTAVSTVFAFATISFAAAMLVAPLVFHRISASWIALAACMLGAGGLGLGGLGQSLLSVQVGYGVLFGVANGVGYSLALQVANQALPRRRGLATGVVVAAYALGTVVFTPIFQAGVEVGGPWTTFTGMAVLMAGAGALIWYPLRSVGRAARGAIGVGRIMGEFRSGRRLWLLWTGWLFGASAGLMTLGHAASLVSAYGGPVPAIAAGTALMAATNGFGRVAAGWLSDHFPVASILTMAAAIGAVSLLFLAFWPAPNTVYASLALVGLSYGLLAAGYPAAVAYLYGAHRVSAMFGVVFTAWGVAGLCAPVIAGAIVDRTGDYRLALALAGASAVVSMLCNVALSRAKA